MSKLNSVALIEKYLVKRGYKVTPMTLGPSPKSAFIMIESPTGAHLTLSIAALSYPFATGTAREIISNKIRSYDFAKSLGIPIPDTLHVPVKDYSDSDLERMLKSHPQLIVKPHNSFQSRGLTVDIKTKEQLTAAIELSSKISETALIQQQVSGEEIRLIAVNGEVRSALLRQKPFIIGDSSSTVAELIAKENDSRRMIKGSIIAYPQLDANLIPADLLNSQRVLKTGERLELNKKTMIRGGASVYDIFSTIHPSYIAIAQNALEHFGKGLVAADFMIRDYTKPATTDNYALIEFNGAISLPMCYGCRDGKQFKIVEDYIGPMLEKAIG